MSLENVFSTPEYPNYNRSILKAIPFMQVLYYTHPFNDWMERIRKNMLSRGWDPCEYYCGDQISLLDDAYTDNGEDVLLQILFGKEGDLGLPEHTNPEQNTAPLANGTHPPRSDRSAQACIHHYSIQEGYAHSADVSETGEENFLLISQRGKPAVPYQRISPPTKTAIQGVSLPPLPPIPSLQIGKLNLQPSYDEGKNSRNNESKDSEKSSALDHVFKREVKSFVETEIHIRNYSAKEEKIGECQRVDFKPSKKVPVLGENYKAANSFCLQIQDQGKEIAKDNFQKVKKISRVSLQIKSLEKSLKQSVRNINNKSISASQTGPLKTLSNTTQEIKIQRVEMQPSRLSISAHRMDLKSRAKLNNNTIKEVKKSSINKNDKESSPNINGIIASGEICKSSKITFPKNIYERYSRVFLNTCLNLSKHSRGKYSLVPTTSTTTTRLTPSLLPPSKSFTKTTSFDFSIQKQQKSQLFPMAKINVIDRTNRITIKAT